MSNDKETKTSKVPLDDLIQTFGHVGSLDETKKLVRERYSLLSHCVLIDTLPLYKPTNIAYHDKCITIDFIDDTGPICDWLMSIDVAKKFHETLGKEILKAERDITDIKRATQNYSEILEGSE